MRPRLTVVAILLMAASAAAQDGPPCRLGPSGFRPTFRCSADWDCVNCDSPQYYYAFCDEGRCHFNNDGRGARLHHGPTDDIRLHKTAGSHCTELVVPSGNSRYQCWGDYWAQFGKDFDGFDKGLCPSGMRAVKQTKVCEGQGAPATTVTVYEQADQAQ